MKLQLQELNRRFRVRARDLVEPFLWADEDVEGWFNDAEQQAAIRGRLLPEDAEPTVCSISLQVGQASYALHGSVFEIIVLRLLPAGGGRPREIELRSREWLDARVPGWRECTEPARYAIQNETSLRVVGGFGAGDTLALECYRLPLRPMAQPTDAPEIHEAHHDHLVDWVLYRAFSIPDADTFDPQRSTLAELDFTKYFGKLPDSNLRRDTRHDQHQHNVVFWG